MTRRSTWIGALALSGILAMGCGKKDGATTPPTKTVPTTPTAQNRTTATNAPGTPAPALARRGETSALASKVVPKGVDWVGGVNVEPLFESALYFQFQPFIDWALGQDEVKQLVEMTKLQPTSFQQLVGGGTYMPPSGVGALKGTFDAGPLVEIIRKEIKLELAQKKAGDVTYYEADRAPVAFGATAKDVLSGGTPGMLAKSIEGGTGGPGEGLLGVQRQIDTRATLWFVTAVPDFAKDELHKAIKRFRIPLMRGVKELTGATHAGISIDLARSIVIQGAITLASAEDAKTLSKQLALAVGSFEMLTSLAFDAFAVTADGPHVLITLQLNQVLWERILFWSALGTQFGMVAMPVMSDSKREFETQLMEEKRAVKKEMWMKKKAEMPKAADRAIKVEEKAPAVQPVP